MKEREGREVEENDRKKRTETRNTKESGMGMKGKRTGENKESEWRMIMK